MGGVCHSLLMTFLVEVVRFVCVCVCVCVKWLC